MSENEMKPTILDAIRVSYFPQALRKICDDEWEARLDGWFEKFKDKIRQICAGDSTDTLILHSLLCERVPVDEKKGCYRDVCYNEYGQVVHVGPVMCESPKGIVEEGEVEGG